MVPVLRLKLNACVFSPFVLAKYDDKFTKFSLMNCPCSGPPGPLALITAKYHKKKRVNSSTVLSSVREGIVGGETSCATEDSRSTESTVTGPAQSTTTSVPCSQHTGVPPSR